MCATLAAEQKTPLESFQTEFIHGSGINPALYATAVKVVGDLESNTLGEAETPIHEALNWRYSRFGLRANESLLAALLLNEDGSCWQAKLSRPKQDNKSRKIRKYETPVGNGSRAFLPAVPTELAQSIGQRYGFKPDGSGSFWDWVADCPAHIPIVITEGGKKALAALSQGYVTIALYGVNSGVSKYETIAGERIRRLKPELIPDLQRFAVEGRQFILAFDQDIKPKTRHKVEGALADLSWHLEQTGASVSIVDWDGQNGRCKGLDDLIVNAGVEAWHSAYKSALPAGEWRIGRQLAAAVKRQPDLPIGNQEFRAVTEQLPQSGIVALYGGKGTGKSEAIAQLLGDNDWLSFTPLVSLGRDQAETWGGVFINDSDVIGSHLLKDGLLVKGASVCIPSLLKVQRMEGGILILDELTATLEFLLGSKLANKDGLRPLLLSEFIRRVQAADLVILADADLTEEAIRYIESMRSEQAYLVRSDRQALTYQTTIFDCPLNPTIASLLERFAVLPEHQLIYLNSDSKAMAESLARMLEGVGIKSLLITSDTSGDDLEADFLASKGATIPLLIRMGMRVIITSPTVTQGFSIKSHTDLIDSVWGFYKGGSITAHSMAQSLDRVRSNQVPRFVHIAKRGNAYSKLSKAQTVTAFLKEFKQISTAVVRLTHHSLSPEATVKAEGIDWQSHNLKMLAALEVRRNRGMTALRETLIALLRQEGKQVQFLTPKITQAEASAAGEAIKTARKQVNLAHAQAVAKAQPIDDEKAKKLSDQTETLTPEEILSLARWQLLKFYRLETVETEDVLLDRKGTAQKEIRNLEAALSHATAIERSASSINRNADTPQDWDKSAVRRWLMEQAGMTQLIAQIIAGEVNELTTEMTKPISQFIRNHAAEFRLGFGFTKIGSMSDQQIIGVMLATCGITTKRHRRRGAYSIEPERLAYLLAVLERRQPKDPHPVSDDINSGVWISSEPLENQELVKSHPQQPEIVSGDLVPVGDARWEVDDSRSA
ncbi:DUF3854 domain-containing protein [filamentous cyanobacterium LEGE 11480]|uniref:DUF3854 domain-containing protein n=1 Tax=Romeriopsis navalis LEGE 11480 TaxID=2777977 RepID=A0A928VVJ9_9CYAN|nr:plasmid replication protein, CyRepA1 family [Romeriopsis navalis]MBE9033277.1 DUF3854 domain-containing protein [Romeriopsis navalis LEGE 11480]